VVAAVDHDLAVDDHGGDSGRVLMRLLVRRAVGEAGGIEHGRGRPGPGPQEANVQRAELDPRFTSARVGLGKALIKKSRLPEARRELEAVLEEKAPTNLADWTMKDSRRARELLESIRGKS
jgi:hypothetical protein